MFIKRFSEKLREARTKKGYSQRRLAREIGVTSSCMCQYENAKRLPNIEIVYEISKILDVSIDSLVSE